MLNKLKNIDRRIIFIFIFLAVLIPLLKPINLPTQVSQPVQNIYDFVEKIPEGKIVLMSFDYGPSTKIEINPMALSLVRQCFRRNLRIVGICLWPEGANLSREVFNLLSKEYHKEYGKDYVNLGFKAGGEPTLVSLGKVGFKELCPQDIDNKPIKELPLMQEINKYDSFALVLTFSAGVPGIKEYIRVTASQYKIPVAGGCTAVSASEMYPFLASGQLLGLMGGLKGASEYEKLVGAPGDAIKGMDAQSVAHLLIVLLIIFTNLIYFLEKAKKKT
ncbi:MAG: hypothetical protein HYU63_08960 [Armatimonadetes bacterium]|nr:hypothetical protein [Armatimonadota bacterium]